MSSKRYDVIPRWFSRGAPGNVKFAPRIKGLSTKEAMTTAIEAAREYGEAAIVLTGHHEFAARVLCELQRPRTDRRKVTIRAVTCHFLGEDGFRNDLLKAVKKR